ncbi:MAG: hypothetical protein KAU10_07605, partial [Dehalococcoidia bacterium]|nr:hypothetical protein [Dehalococcoidia bacterium]
VIEHTEYPFAKGDLTSDGVQWSAEVDTTTPDTDVEVECVTIQPPALGEVIEIEFGLTAALRAVSSATADLIYKWQGRNKGGTWVDLHSYVTIENVDTTYVERTMSGYRIEGVTNLDAYPLDVRLVIQSNETTPGVATARVKSSSYVEVELK